MTWKFEGEALAVNHGNKALPSADRKICLGFDLPWLPDLHSTQIGPVPFVDVSRAIDLLITMIKFLTKFMKSVDYPYSSH